MKKILLIFLLFLSATASAQNWQSVRMNDTVYYTIPSANDYLRVIWIDSATVSGTDSIFHFYPSIRLGNTTSNCLDTLGPTWLGKNFIKKTNGDEVYFNRWLDTIILKPTSALNTTWLMHTDTANNEYRATITSFDTMTIDNQLDSIKEVTIEVFNNNVPVATNVHHNKKIILSKNHGFVECLEWYGFPDDYTVSQNFPNSNYYFEWFGNYSGLHIRLPKSFNYIKPFRTDPNVVYKPGNEIHQYRKWNNGIFPGFARFYTIDSFVSYQNYGQDSVIIQKKHSYYNGGAKTQTIEIDTISLGTNQIMAEIIRPEYSEIMKPYFLSTGLLSVKPFIPCGLDYIFTSHGSGSNFISFNSNTNCTEVGASLSGWTNGFSQFVTGLPYQFKLNQYGFTPNSQQTFDTVTTVYFKFDTCTFGTPINFNALSQKNIMSLEQGFLVYPNPSSNKVHFTPKDNTKILSAKLYSLLGKEVGSCNNCNELKTTEIANGLYLLNIETNKGIVRKKIVVQH